MFAAWQSATLVSLSDGLTGNLVKKIHGPQRMKHTDFCDPLAFHLSTTSRSKFYSSSELSQHLLDESAQYLGSFQMMNINDTDYLPTFPLVPP